MDAERISCANFGQCEQVYPASRADYLYSGRLVLALVECMNKVVQLSRRTRLFGATSRFAALLATISTAGCLGYVPGQNAHWDAQVQTHCEKDGGLTVLEIAEVSRQEYELFQGAIRAEKYSGTAPVFRRTTQTTIRESNPQVWRLEQSAIRRSDGKVLATHVDYARVGGDLPTGLAHESSFLCPGGPALRIEDIVRLKD